MRIISNNDVVFEALEIHIEYGDYGARNISNYLEIITPSGERHVCVLREGTLTQYKGIIRRAGMDGYLNLDEIGLEIIDSYF